MYTINIKYAAPAVEVVNGGVGIARLHTPGASYVDSKAYAGTAYDTNVEGFGTATTLEDYLNSMTAHPGIVAALRQAMKEGEFVIEGADWKDHVYALEIAPALAAQGFTITSAAAGDAAAVAEDEE